MILWLAAACWQPDPSLAPELPPLDPVGADEADAHVEDPAEGEPAPADPAEAGPAEAGVEAAEPAEAAFAVYSGYTTASPVTIVDDYGRPLSIIPKLGTEVEVRAEESIRRKIYCATCSPAVEGWVQTVTVTGRGEQAPRSARILPPGAPTPGFVPGG